MKVSAVNGCCSMVTISENPHFNNFKTKRAFKNHLITEIIKQGFNISNIKTAMIVTNRTFWDEYAPRPFWLRSSHKYNGNNGKAYVIFINLT